jgi:hypothetical protein
MKQRDIYLYLTHLQGCPLYALQFAADRHYFVQRNAVHCQTVSSLFLPWNWYENKRHSPAQIWRPSTVRVGGVRAVPMTTIQVSPTFQKDRSVFVFRVIVLGECCFTLHMKALWSTETSVMVPVFTASRRRKTWFFSCTAVRTSLSQFDCGCLDMWFALRKNLCLKALAVSGGRPLTF